LKIHKIPRILSSNFILTFTTALQKAEQSSMFIYTLHNKGVLFMNKEQLMNEARGVLKNSYSPYSNFPVGAALLLTDGSVIFTALTQGYKKGDFVAIAVAGDTDDFLPPCSICRQVMAEFFTPNMPVYLTNRAGDIKELALKELLPFAFTELDM